MPVAVVAESAALHKALTDRDKVLEEIDEITFWKKEA